MFSDRLTNLEKGRLPPSAYPSPHDTAALYVAIALAPTLSNRRALAASQARGRINGASFVCSFPKSLSGK